jgi:hypothetical protein
MGYSLQSDQKKSPTRSAPQTRHGFGGTVFRRTGTLFSAELELGKAPHAGFENSHFERELDGKPCPPSARRAEAAFADTGRVAPQKRISTFRLPPTLRKREPMPS